MICLFVHEKWFVNMHYLMWGDSIFLYGLVIQYIKWKCCLQQMMWSIIDTFQYVENHWPTDIHLLTKRCFTLHSYYEVTSPPPRLRVETVATPSPDNPLCTVIPLHGDDVRIRIDEEEKEKGDVDIREDELYTSIMAEAMSVAPTISAPELNLPRVDDSPRLVERRRSLSSPAHGLHRRSYQLATRRESSEGKTTTRQNAT